MNYDNIKKNVKILLEKYDNNIKLKFNKYIDNIDFKINETLICHDLYNEIILINNIIITNTNNQNNGDLYTLWKRIYIKYFNPIIIIGAGVAGLTIASGLINASDSINESELINASKFNK